MSDPATDAAFDALVADDPRPATSTAPETDPHNADDGPPVLPAALWTDRPALAQVAQAAHHRLVSPDALLGAVLARIAVAVPHVVKLPAIIGGPIGLTTYVVAVGPPGSGKSAAARVAADLIPLPADVPAAPIGSGEGLVELLHEVVRDDDGTGKKVPVKRQTRHRALVTVDEGSALGELGNRKGSTLLSTLRSAWTDAPLGNANASAERRRIIPAGLATLGVLIGLQPAKAGPLLDDVDAGTPQRCLWLAADHPNPPDTIPAWPGGWTWNPPGPTSIDRLPIADSTYRFRIVNVPDRVRDDVIARRRAVQARRLRVDPWRAHDDLLRLKVGTLLAILDGRLDVTDDDWRVAGTIVDTSAAVRDHCRDAVAAVDGERERRHRQKLVGRDAVLETHQRDRTLDRLAKTLARSARKHGPLTQSDATRALAGRDRKLVTVDEALDRAVADGLLDMVADRDGTRWAPGRRRP